jgi:large subunit ribosomal protein L30
MATIKIKQIKSVIGRPETQCKTLCGVGLGRIGQIVEVPDNECTRGMIAKVKHLIEVK